MVWEKKGVAEHKRLSVIKKWAAVLYACYGTSQKRAPLLSDVGCCCVGCSSELYLHLCGVKINLPHSDPLLAYKPGDPCLQGSIEAHRFISNKQEKMITFYDQENFKLLKENAR